MARSGSGRNILSVGDILSRTFSVWKKNAIAYGLLGILFGSPTLVAIILDPSGENSMFAFIVRMGGMLSGVVVSGAVAFGVFQQLRGQQVALGECIQKGLSRFLPILLTGIVVTVLIAGGFVLLIVPGVILMCGLYVAVPVATVENPGLIQALKRSWELTQNHKVTVFSANFVLGITLFLVALPIGFGIAIVGDGLVIQLVLQAISLFLGALAGVMGAVIYHDLRVKKEGLGTDELVKVFE